MFTESVALKGNLSVVLYDENYIVKDQRDVKNLVVSVGKNHIADRMVANTTPVMSHMAIGSGNVNPTTSDTAMNTEVSRVALTSSTRTNNTIAYITTFGAGVGTGTIAEAGIFNALSGGTMLCRTRFNAVNKGASDVIVITWNVTVE
jgi:hypothetical protein